MGQQFFGEYLRQLRREQELTQVELGSSQFSKSYVSAVERGAVVPSRAALLHFAEVLQRPLEDFERALRESQIEQPVVQSIPSSSFEENDQDFLSLLDVVLKGNQKISPSLSLQLEKLVQIPSFSGPWQERQVRLLFLQGLLRQEQGDLLQAQAAFEQALALASTDYQLYLNNALGKNYALAGDYLSALRYHQRALALLKAEESIDLDLLQQIEYSCGDDYRALSCHEQACQHFERACQHIQSRSDIASAGQLYLGLGYCTYAALFQRSHDPSTREDVSSEHIERSYQLAVSYLVQSRMLYQVGGELFGELRARLTQTLVLLDWSFWKYSLLLSDHSFAGQKGRLLGGANLLDDASEQCQQVLLMLIEHYGEKSTPPAKVSTVAVTTMAYLIRVAVRRAVQARMNGYADTATRERLMAVHLCERLLSFLQSEHFAWDCVQHCVHITGRDINYRERSITPFDVLDKVRTAFAEDSAMQVEVCLAFGELDEEIALTEYTEENGQASFQLANQCFQQALLAARQYRPGKEYDSSYALRVYQCYIAILELRLQQVPADANFAAQLLGVVKDACSHFLSAMTVPLIENAVP